MPDTPTPTPDVFAATFVTAVQQDLLVQFVDRLKKDIRHLSQSLGEGVITLDDSALSDSEVYVTVRFPEKRIEGGSKLAIQEFTIRKDHDNPKKLVLEKGRHHSIPDGHLGITMIDKYETAEEALKALALEVKKCIPALTAHRTLETSEPVLV